MTGAKIIFTTGLLATLLLGSGYARADWEQDYEIDQKLELIGRPWSISFPHMNIVRELTTRIEQNLPPYSQQPENAQKVKTEPTDSGTPTGSR
ncbi:MAG: hypothetical protein KGY56_14380 [Desulfobacterales bacterium]|nr:hypothetical protein [Desulfobacterales bacterium]